MLFGTKGEKVKRRKNLIRATCSGLIKASFSLVYTLTHLKTNDIMHIEINYKNNLKLIQVSCALVITIGSQWSYCGQEMEENTFSPNLRIPFALSTHIVARREVGSGILNMYIKSIHT
jgi:hypothetical protein